MNVLITGVGRRSYLVRYFQAALQGRGYVIAANSVADAPGMQVADIACPVPPSYDPGYGEHIAAICREHGVRLLCSCHDLDGLALADERDRLDRENVFAMLPTPEWARLCLDKQECGAQLRKAGFDVPWTGTTPEEALCALKQGEIGFPLLVKARHGFGSLGMRPCHDIDELRWFYHRAEMEFRDSILGRFLVDHPRPSILVQEYIGGPELRVILVNDFSGRPAAHFITEVHAMRAGESDRATTLAPDRLGDFPERLARLTGHVGIWGIDVRMIGERPIIIDINPRFTGDYPFQHLAGADVPAALVAWSEGNQPNPAWLRSKTGVSGYKDILPTLCRHAD